MASQFPPKKNTAFTLYFSLYKNDGSIIANPGTYTKKRSIDGAAVGDISASITEEDTTYGQLSVVLSADDMNGDAIWVYIKDDTSGCVPFTCTLYTTANLMDDIKTDTAAILVDTGTTLDGAISTIDGIVDAIKAKTDSLTFTGAGKVDANVVNWKNAAASDFTGKITGDYDNVSSAALANLTFTVAGKVDSNVTHWKGSAARDMTGDAYARLGAPVGASISADIAAAKAQLVTIQADTDLLDDAVGGLADIHTDLAGLITDIGANGAGLTAIPWNASWDAEVESECDDAITNSGIKGAGFDTVTDSLKALRNHGDTSWVTATGFSTHTPADVKTAMEAVGSYLAEILTDTGTTIPGTITTLQGNVTDILTDTGTTLDTLIKDIPTTAEFEARTIAAADYTIVSDLGVVQTGDSFAIVNGDHGLVSIQDDIDEILTDTGTTLDTLIKDIPTTVEFEARTLAAADYLVADDVLDEAVEGTVTLRQAMQVLMSFAAAKASGGGTAAVTFRNLADDADRIVMTVDASGNRTDVTLTF